MNSLSFKLEVEKKMKYKKNMDYFAYVTAHYSIDYDLLLYAKRNRYYLSRNLFMSHLEVRNGKDESHLYEGG